MAAPQTTGEPQVVVTSQSENPQTPTPQNEKSGKGTKIALIVLVIFLLIVLSEVGYLVFSGYGRTFFELTSPQSTPVSLPIPQIKEDPVLTKSTFSSEKISNFQERIDYIWKNKQSFLESASVEFTLEGEVLYTTQAVDGDFAYAIVLTNEDGEEIRYAITQQEFDNADAYIIQNNEILSIPLTSLRMGDKVVIKSIGNILDSTSDFHLIFQVTRP